MRCHVPSIGLAIHFIYALLHTDKSRIIVFRVGSHLQVINKLK